MDMGRNQSWDSLYTLRDGSVPPHEGSHRQPDKDANQTPFNMARTSAAGLTVIYVY